MTTLTYQDLVITMLDPKALGTVLRDLAEQGVKTVTFTKKGIEYQQGRMSLYVGSIGFSRKTMEYPEGVTCEGRTDDGRDRLEDIKTSIWKEFGAHPKPEPPKPKGFHRTWMTPEQYERQKAENPTLSTMGL